MSFADLAVIEPRLLDLESEAVARRGRERRAKRPDPVSAWHGYGRYAGRGLKAVLLVLVGWSRLPPGYVPPPTRLRRGPVSIGVAIAEGVEEIRAQRAAIASLPAEQQELEATLASTEAFDVTTRHLLGVLGA